MKATWKVLANTPETHVTAQARPQENKVQGGSDYPSGHLGVMAGTKNNWRKRHNQKDLVISRVRKGTIDTTGTLA